jgi:type I restriction enzyme S subunit
MSNQLELLQQHFDTALESPDGIKKLRELILTLAMQGKLVPQDPKDQPASELLKEIQAEKERLIKEGKTGPSGRRVRKQKKLPPIKLEEVPYAVPEGWVWTRLGEVGSIERGKSKHRPRNDKRLFDGGTYPLVQTGDVSQSKYSNFLITTCGSYYNDFGLAQSRLWSKGTLCITIAANIAETGFLGMDACIPDSVVTFTPWRNNSINFVKTFIDLAKNDLENFAPSTAQKNINLAILNELAFPLPPLAEQKRIVARIDELMALCDKLEAQRNARNDKRLAVHTAAINRLLTAADKNDFDAAWQFITRNFNPLYSVKENVAELKKAILTLAMQGKLVKQDPNDQPASELLKEIQAEKERLIKEGKTCPSGRRVRKQKKLPPIKPDEVPYAVPEGWVWVRLGTLANYNFGKTPASKNPIYWSESDGCHWTSISDMPTRGYLETTSKKVTHKAISEVFKYEPVPVGSLLMSFKLSIGKTAITKIETYHNEAIISFVYLDERLKMYLFWILHEVANSGNMKGAIKGRTLNSKSISELLIPLPPLAEQKRIVARIDELMALCDKLESQIDQATTKQTALFDAVLAEV